jgi:hypothetical protein
MYRFRLILILALASGSSSCWLKKTTPVRVFVPPPSKPRSLETVKVPDIPPPPDDIEASGMDAAAYPEIPNEGPATIPAAGPPPVPPRRPAPRATTTPQPPAVVEPPPTAPKLGPIFTADQLREYNRSIDDSLDRVRKVLASVNGRTLNPQLMLILNRIQTFQKQAEQARESDLVTAVNLARRADLLAQDLVKRLP